MSPVSCFSNGFLFYLILYFEFSLIVIISQISVVLDSSFAEISIIGRIRLARWWVWRWWVWIRVRWYMRLSFLLWQLCWLCWQICWLCSWHGFWCFFSIGIESNCEFVTLVVFVTIWVEYNFGRLIEIFWRPKSWFYLQIWKSVL